jgi:SmpA / OmlA family
MRHRIGLLILCAGGLLTLVVCAPFFWLAFNIGIVVLTTRPGIGDVKQAEIKIEVGMTKDEVRSMLGEPHLTGACGGEEWDYWETVFVSSVLRVYFGPNGRVTSRESWCQ